MTRPGEWNIAWSFGGVSSGSFQWLDLDIAIGDGIIMAGETEEAGFPVFSRVGPVAHELLYLAEVCIEDGGAVQFDFYFGSVDGDFLEVPFADRSEVPAVRGDHTVSGAVELSGVEAGVPFRGVVEDLEFAHTDVCGIALTGITNGESIVSAGGQFEFDAGFEVGQGFIEIDGSTFMGFADDGSIFDLKILDWTSPSIEVFTVENTIETVVVVVCQDFIGFLCGDFSYEDIAPADFSSVGLQLNGSGSEEGLIAIPVILHGGVVDDQFSVEVDGGTGTDLNNSELVPVSERLVCEDERVFAGGAAAIVPQSTGAFIGAYVPFAAFFCGIPDLHLRGHTQVDTAIGIWDGFVFEEQFNIAVFLQGGGVRSVTVIDQLTILDGPVCTKFLLIFLPQSLFFLLAHRFVFARVGMAESEPAVQILSIEEGFESFGWLSCERWQRIGAEQGHGGQRIDNRKQSCKGCRSRIHKETFVTDFPGGVNLPACVGWNSEAGRRTTIVIGGVDMFFFPMNTMRD